MGLDQALYEMELVGHDFFLFHDKDTNQPSVVLSLIHISEPTRQGQETRSCSSETSRWITP